MKTQIEVLVDGIVKLTIPNADIREDGSIWSSSSDGPAPLVNGFLLAKHGIAPVEVAKSVKTGKFSQQLKSCFMSLGENPGGRFVLDRAAAQRKLDADREAAMTPVDREKRTVRREIADLERRAARCDRSEDDVQYDRLRFEAEKLQDDFYRKFPEELLEDRADNLRWRASEKRRIADGAMLYDCDGSLSYADQCAARDRGYAEAAKLDAEAAELDGNDE